MDEDTEGKRARFADDIKDNFIRGYKASTKICCNLRRSGKWSKKKVKSNFFQEK